MRLFKKHKRSLSVVIVFFNMQREAKRTLWSLTVDYQFGVSVEDYEVIVLDNASTEPLDGDWVCGLQENFSYHYLGSEYPSPCVALNTGVDKATGEHVICMVDGARILSPGILHSMMRGFNAVPNAYIYTLGFHLGHIPQHKSVHDGYCQKVEDQLLKEVPWMEDGYYLFDISSPAASAREGFLGITSESNCFGLKKRTFEKLEGYNEKFVSRGGGMCNLEVHNRLVGCSDLEPMLLLGEGTFHQFHGGVATNTERLPPILTAFSREYSEVVGEEYTPTAYVPLYFGKIHPKSTRFIGSLGPG